MISWPGRSSTDADDVEALLAFEFVEREAEALLAFAAAEDVIDALPAFADKECEAEALPTFVDEEFEAEALPAFAYKECEAAGGVCPAGEVIVCGFDCGGRGEESSLLSWIGSSLLFFSVSSSARAYYGYAIDNGR